MEFDSKRELLWVEWQTLAGHFSDDVIIIGEWFRDILDAYSEPQRRYHNLSHIYAMILNYRHFQQELTYPKTVLFAIFFHDMVYDPQSPDNEEESVKLFESCASDLGVDSEVISETSAMIRLTASGHRTAEHDSDTPFRARDIHYFLDFDLAILGSNPVEYTIYAKQIREEYSHVPDEEFCGRRADILGKFLERKHVFASREFRQFAEKRARENVEREVEILRGRARQLEMSKTHTCGKGQTGEEGGGGEDGEV